MHSIDRSTIFQAVQNYSSTDYSTLVYKYLPSITTRSDPQLTSLLMHNMLGLSCGGIYNMLSYSCWMGRGKQQRKKNSLTSDVCHRFHYNRNCLHYSVKNQLLTNIYWLMRYLILPYKIHKDIRYTTQPLFSSSRIVGCPIYKFSFANLLFLHKSGVCCVLCCFLYCSAHWT